jgi:dihydroorotase
VYDLLTTLSKYLHMGVSLDDVIALGTSRPAAALRRQDRSGSLRVGAEADIAVLELREGRFTFTDAMGATRQGRQALLPVVTLRAGRRHSPLHSAHPHLHGHAS